MKEIEEMNENWSDVEVTKEEIEKGDNLNELLAIENKRKALMERIVLNEEKGEEEKERLQIVPQVELKDMQKLQQQYNQLNKRKNDLNKYLMNYSPMYNHPKQYIITHFIHETHPTHQPIFLVNLPITIHNTDFYQAINSLFQSFFKNTVVVKDRLVGHSTILLTHRQQMSLSNTVKKKMVV